MQRTFKKEKKEEEKNISNVSRTLPIKSKKGNIEEKNKVSSFEVEEKKPAIYMNIKRPNFTEDEINLMQNDFNNLDINNEGKIKPSFLLIFVEKNEDFKKKTPIYYQALKELNTKENNLNGVNFEQFVEAVKNVIRENNKNNIDNWGNIFKNNFENKDSLFDAIKELGLEMSDDEIKNLISKMGKDVDQKQFISIMKTVEKKEII